MLSVIPINYDNKELLNLFLAAAGNSLQKFRYFDKRPITVLKQHLSTYLLIVDSKPVAYGHLDYEEDVVWLGVAVVEDYVGKGLGKLMMEVLIVDAKLKGIDYIQLAVDNDNNRALQMYKKKGFEILHVKETCSLMKYTL